MTVTKNKMRCSVAGRVVQLDVVVPRLIHEAFHSVSIIALRHTSKESYTDIASHVLLDNV